MNRNKHRTPEQELENFRAAWKILRNEDPKSLWTKSKYFCASESDLEKWKWHLFDAIVELGTEGGLDCNCHRIPKALMSERKMCGACRAELILSHILTHNPRRIPKLT